MKQICSEIEFTPKILNDMYKNFNNITIESNNSDKKKIEELKNEIKNYNIYDFLLGISALNLIPENQSKSIIFNTVISAALSIPITDYNMNNKISMGKFKSIVKKFENLDIKRNIDPPEFPFIQKVIFYKNYDLFMGVNNVSNLDIQSFLYTLKKNNNNLTEPNLKRINTYIEMLLNISTNISSKLKIKSMLKSNHSYDDDIIFPNSNEFKFLKEILIQNVNDYLHLKLDNESFDSLFFEHCDSIYSDYLDFDNQYYYFHPLLKISSDEFFPLDITIFPLLLMNKICSIILNDKNSQILVSDYINITKREIVEYYHMMGCYKINASKHDIQLLDNINYTEQIFSNGNDNIIISISPIDNGDNYSKDKIVSTFKMKMDDQFIYNHLKEVVSKLNDIGTPNDKIMIIVTPFSMGRNFIFEVPNVGIETLSLHKYELRAISINETSQNMFLKRYLISKNKIKIMPSLFSELNLISMYIEKDYSFYFDDNIDMKETSLHYLGEYSSSYIEKADRKENKHLVSSYDKNYNCEVIKNDDDIYIVNDHFRDKCLKICVEKENKLVWIITDIIDDVNSLGLYKNTMDYISYWFNIYLDDFKGNFNVTIKLKLNDEITKYFISQNIDEMSDALKISEGIENIIFDFYPSIMTILNCEDNLNEKKLFIYMVKELEQILKINLYNNEIIEKIFANPNRKRSVTLRCEEFAYLKPFRDNKERLINAADVNIILDEIGLLVKNKKNLSYGKISLNESKNICNFIVDKLYKDISNTIKKFNKRQLLYVLYYESERILSNLMIQKESYINNLACFPQHKDDIDKRFNESNKSSMAIRFLIELSSSFEKCGDNIIGEYELELLMAKSSLLIEWAYRSDLFNYKMMVTPLEMLKSNRLGFNHDEYYSINNSFVTLREEQMGSVGRDKMKELLNGFVREKMNDEKFEDIFFKEYGFGTNELFVVFWELIDLCEGEICEINIIKLIDVLHDNLSEEKIRKIVDRFSLKSRKNFLEVDKPYSKEDVYPWRFNRELSFNRRPLILDGENIIWGNRNLSNSVFFLFDLISNGKLKSHSLEMKQYISKINENRGKNFNNMIFNYISKFPNVIVDKNVSKVNKEKIADFNKDTLGDIDVLCIIPKNKKIILIETKNFNSVKNYYELYNEYKNIFIDEEGYKSFLTKHKKRAKWIQEHIQDVIEEYNLPIGNYNVYYMFVTSEYCLANKVFNLKENIFSAKELNYSILINLKKNKL